MVLITPLNNSVLSVFSEPSFISSAILKAHDDFSKLAKLPNIRASHFFDEFYAINNHFTYALHGCTLFKKTI